MQNYFSNASKAWNQMDAFRSERARCKRYVYGEQWDDVIQTAHGRMTEREFLRRQGQEPLKNNLLRRILRNIVGLYRAQYKVPLLTTKETGLKGKELKEVNDRRRQWFFENRMEEFAPRLLEEFLISGLVSVKVADGKILPVTPDNFFFRSDGYDPRGHDIDLIGEVHTLSYTALIERFCRSAEQYDIISHVYDAPNRPDEQCRLLEVWTKETQSFSLHHDEDSSTLRMHRESAPFGGAGGRHFVKTAWVCHWYAPDGTFLHESGPQERHPYVFKAYPFIDGEIHSYISDIIDQQRYVNRLITLYDLIMRSSAKGVLLFPDECIPAGMDLQDVADEWGCFNGVIPYRARPGVPMPTQVSANSTNIGITDLLKIEMQMLEDISSVSPTLQGKLVTNSTSGTLFSQQNEAAQTSLLDVLRSFTDFLRQLYGEGVS